MSHRLFTPSFPFSQQYINNEVIAKIDDVSRAISRLKSKIGLEEEAKSLLTEAQAVTRDIKTKSKTIIENAVDKFIENLRIIGKEAVHQVLGAMQTDIGNVKTTQLLLMYRFWL